jgi:transcription elongation factor GreA
MEKFILTQEGKENYEKRLKELRNEIIPAVIQRIKAARELGDLSENAEYHSARDEKAQLDGEALEIEAILKNCEIAVKKDSDTIDVGTKFKYYDVDMEEEYVFTLVGTAEADYTKQKISTDSPVGLAVLGKKVGDEITVKTPKGEEYQIKITEILD